MAKAKGTLKTGGRQKGTPNKVTTDLRQWVKKIIDENSGQLEKDLQKLEPKERWQIIEKLMQYTLPKLQSVEAQIEQHLDNLTDEQIDIIINQLTNSIENE